MKRQKEPNTCLLGLPQFLAAVSETFLWPSMEYNLKIDGIKFKELNKYGLNGIHWALPVSNRTVSEKALFFLLVQSPA